jgi:hypothetical protein
MIPSGRLDVTCTVMVIEGVSLCIVSLFFDAGARKEEESSHLEPEASALWRHEPIAQ